MKLDFIGEFVIKNKDEKSTSSSDPKSDSTKLMPVKLCMPCMLYSTPLVLRMTCILYSNPLVPYMLCMLSLLFRMSMLFMHAVDAIQATEWTIYSLVKSVVGGIL